MKITRAISSKVLYTTMYKSPASFYFFYLISKGAIYYEQFIKQFKVICKKRNASTILTCIGGIGVAQVTGINAIFVI